jgi:16S rRNA (cytidine1402-2'-O)-methyltransferase
VALSRELSKLHEETLRGTVEELLEHLQGHPPRGEYVVVVGAAD